MLASETEIGELIDALRGSPWIALDTEADSLHAYPEKLCLIQISHAGGDVLVDPLMSSSLAPLLEHLAGRTMILHGADFDLRLLRRTRGFVAHEVFDTAIAAQLLGRPRHGLRDLVSELLGVQLHKGAQRADWSRRPLSAQMIAYAQNDTRYLSPLRDQLEAQLRERDRLTWHREACARLVKACARAGASDPTRVWRIKGSAHLGPRALAVLRELWGWRESEALRLDRPPYFVLSHELVLAIAERAGRGDGAGERPPVIELPPGLRSRQRAEIDEAIARAWAVPEETLPERERTERPPRPGADLVRRNEALRQRRDLRAAELEIEPTLIASKAEIAALAEDWDQGLAGLMSWQAALLGP
ncbi:MAG: HRDC domain-containing protein [Nannocystis sp.]|nr:HRDC domain-containing protein [Nannocystis sp.]MBA3549195.1 HRDC domain-containing protein [Nannocystis sp.]